MAELLGLILDSPLNFVGTLAVIFFLSACLVVIIQAIGRHIMGWEEEGNDES